MQVNGVINVYKEQGFTSHDVIAVLRGVLQVKKIGHTGTLDPDATGVLPVCVGKATKVADLIMGSDKEYVASLAFGSETDTQDASGKVLRRFDYQYQAEAVQDAVASFVGTYEQMPPMYSALKVGGMKLYELAREGLEVERKTRPVRIEWIDLMHQDETGLTMRVRCSKGTYIRTLCEDIGRKLGYGAHMTSLERTASGPYRVENSLPIDTIRQLVQTGSLAECVTDLNSLFADLPYKQVIAAEDSMLRNGNYLTYPMSDVPGQVGRLYRMLTSDGALAGLYRITEVVGEKNRLRAYKMFV